MSAINERMRSFDKDFSGSLDKGEFSKMLGGMSKGIKDTLFNILDEMDGNKDGEISFDKMDSKKSNKDSYKDFLKKMIEMMGGDPEDLKGKTLSELQDMLDELMGKGKKSCSPSNSSCPPSSPPACPPSSPPCPPSSPPCPPPPPPPPPVKKHDAGGGMDGKVVATQAQIASDLKTFDANNDNRLSKAEFGTAMDKLNTRANGAGSNSYLNDVEKANLFKLADTNGDGFISSVVDSNGVSEASAFNNFLTSGFPYNTPDNVLTVKDWNTMNYFVPN